MHRFKVDGMCCGGGVKSLCRAVLAVEPDARVEIDLGIKLVIVSGAAGLAARPGRPEARCNHPDRAPFMTCRAAFRPGLEFDILAT